MSKSGSRINLAIIATHPIQYQTPWFRALSEINTIQLKVYYIFVPDARQQGRGFERAFQWDISLLDGYDWTVLTSRAKNNFYNFFGNRIYRFAEQLQKDNIDVCLITGWQSLGLVQAVVACRKIDVKTLVRGDSTPLRIRADWKKLLHRMLFKKFDVFLAVGAQNKRFYTENGVDPARIYWCPHFVDNGRFHRQAEVANSKRQAIRDNWGIRDYKICFVFVGKFENKKRLFDLIHALVLATKKRETMQLLIVGSGSQDMQVRELVRKTSAPALFTGFLNQSEICEAYVAADCLILPSDHDETWGLVVNEAMACGVPALVSDQVGCGADLVIPGNTGLTFRCGDIKDLAQKMIWMTENSDGLRRMGRNAHAHIQEYTMETATRGLLEALNALKS